MTTAARRGILAIVTAVVLLALGAGVGVVVGDALGIRTEPATQMDPAPPTVPAIGAAVPAPVFTAVDVPAGPRFDAAIDSLLDATATAFEREGETSLTVSISGSPSPPTSGREDESYRLTGTAGALQIEAPDVAGAVRGIYDLAAQVRTGRSVAEHLGEEVTSRLPFRMVDMGAVGVEPDPAAWEPGTDYSHASKAFAQVLLPDAPYIDEQALSDAYVDFDEFVKHSLANGYNALAFPGFVEFVAFDEVADGVVYTAGDEHRAQAIALRDAFGPFWDHADELGMDVFLRTDMLTLTTPLEAYLTDRFGSLDTEDPALWDVYAAGLDELYAAEPALDGILIRIGEAGRVYDVDGWDYYSQLAVTTPAAVRAMLGTLSAQAEATDHEVIFRTWSVGVGAVGDMHTSPASYEAVLGGIDSPALIVSTKYTLGDFYSWLPLNDTLEQGAQRRIVEFQSRREFENFGAFPNDLGREYQFALQKLLAANDNIEGIWTWTQDGGPWRAGPMTLYLKAGFWQLYELDTVVAAALARDPETDVADVTAGWARQWFTDDPATAAAIVEAMDLSRDAIEQGMYIQPFAEQRVFAIGLEPPPMMWIFEWDILTGDSAVLDVLYAISRDATYGHIEEAIAGGERAVATVDEMREKVSSTDAATWRDASLREALLGTLDYEADVLRMLAAYREMILYQGQWHDTLAPASYDAWSSARDEFEVLAAAHIERYEGDIDYPAYNLTAAALGVQRADRDLAMAWIARALLLLAAAWLLIGMLASRTRLVRRPGAAAARASWLASTRPWRASESTLGMLPLDRWLMLGVPAALLVATRAVQTSLVSWAHLVIVLGAWLIFVVAVRLLVRRRSPWPVIAAVAGVIVLRCIVALFALSFTGPGGYWFSFWTEPAARTVYISIAFALFVWLFVAAGWALAGQVGRRRATGMVLAAVGLALAIPAAIISAIGLETALSLWNDQMGLLPWGLARILGITVYLDIPADTALWAAVFGVVLAAVGFILAVRWRRPAAA
ncbi:hypothetical protein [Microbacterium pumilum]|uniref:Glycosyl hydrolase family 67 C-terminal domain-containing protein n=1 Tax=Microbacterium pumilum TaxID=344165 RepID=A0ABN2SB05_9MICO